MSMSDCERSIPVNDTAIKEQAHTERNQARLNEVQPAPDVTWSMERDNLIKYKKLQNDRGVSFYVYIFNEGVPQPIGYYLLNKLSSVNSQLTNSDQIISGLSHNNNLPSGAVAVIASPSEDGSYGDNGGDAVFGFTPENIMVQTNMHYITATVPLNFATKVTCLAIINTQEGRDALAASLKAMEQKQ